MLSMAVGAAMTGGGMASASSLSSNSSHTMSVHPVYQYVGKSTGDGAIFGCQSSTAAVSCYSPQALLNAYDIQRVQDKGITGKGQTIVIIDAFGDPTIQQDLDVFDTTFGLPATTVNVINPFGAVFDPTSADDVGWSGEEALDVESSHAVAPGATECDHRVPVGERAAAGELRVADRVKGKA